MGPTLPWGGSRTDDLVVWDVTGGEWLGLAGESLHRDALARLVQPYPDRMRLTWGVLLPTWPDVRATGLDGPMVLTAIRGFVVGWLPPDEAAAAVAGVFRTGARAACCPAAITRTSRGDWVVDLRVDRAVLHGSRPATTSVPLSGLHAG
jgi:hypothetical protein